MTTPAGPAISLSDILAELQRINPARTGPIWLGDPDVLELAQAAGIGPSTPNSLLALAGRTAKPGGAVVLPPGSGQLAVQISPVSSVVASRTVFTVTGTSLATVSGGSGVISSFLWSVSSSQVTVTPSGSSCNFSARLANDSLIEATITLRVTDSAGNVGLGTASLYFENQSVG